jgi:hypothetical protein
MDNIQDLVCEFARVDVVTVRMIGDEGDIKRADVRDEGQSLQEVMLPSCQ